MLFEPGSIRARSTPPPQFSAPPATQTALGSDTIPPQTKVVPVVIVAVNLLLTGSTRTMVAWASTQTASAVAAMSRAPFAPGRRMSASTAPPAGSTRVTEPAKSGGQSLPTLTDPAAVDTAREQVT